MIALVVEEILEDMIELVELIERNSPIRCESCNSGEIAIQFIENKKVDMIFVNFKLCDMPGLTLLEVLKEIAPSTALIMTGPKPNTFVEKRVHSLGGKAYLTKPIVEDKLLKLLNDIKNALA